jgi:hypothetical protein
VSKPFTVSLSCGAPEVAPFASRHSASAVDASAAQSSVQKDGDESKSGLSLHARTRLSYAMRAIIVLAIVTAVLHLSLRYYVVPQFGRDVQDRFIERDKYIPSLRDQHLPDNDGALTAANLLRWISDPAHRSYRQGYVTPVILPLDLLFLIAVGSLLGCLSQFLASRIGLISAWPIIVWWVLPLAYMLCDFIEDGLIVILLSWPSLLHETSFQALRVSTTAKLFTIGAAILEVGALLATWIAARLGFIG